jgi:hypothetical protein
MFVDNDAARIALIKGSSTNVHSDRLVCVFHDYDIDCQSRVWIARVPSHSNPGDPPSRLDFVTNERLFGCTTVKAPRMRMEVGVQPWLVSMQPQL